MTEPTEKLDPALCSFCEDETVPSVGRMLVVVVVTGREVVSYDDSKFGACEKCARGYTGAFVGENEETGEEAVFQFQHQDFEKVADQVDAFAIYLDNLRCQICDARIYEKGEPLGRIAKRFLQNCPDAHYLKATCQTCVAIRGCPDCDNHDHD